MSSSVETSQRTYFRSVLFAPDADADALNTTAPDYFRDLNLDQIWDGIAPGEDEHDLAPYFYTPLRARAPVQYRHGAITDLEREDVDQAVRAFVASMDRIVRLLKLVDKRSDRHQCARWMVSVVRIYCDATTSLASALDDTDLTSEAITGLRVYLQRYSASQEFQQLVTDTTALEQRFAQIHYEVRIRGLHVSVTPYDGEATLGDEVEELFERFTRTEADEHTVSFPNVIANNPVESKILELVARENPELFNNSAEFHRRTRNTYLDPTLARFDREVRFLLAYLDYIKPLTAQVLDFCLPVVSNTDRQEAASDCFDLALAHKLHAERATTVCNDFALQGDERMLVITGPNQGGKTTFARMFGQLHHIAALGLPVPAASAQLFLPDRLFTHFEREEDLQTLRSKFEDELVRLRTILQEATGDSVLVMNESFSSTSLSDAIWVGERLLGRLLEMGTITVYVTFIDELARLGGGVVSMMSSVDHDDVTRRTYKVVRKPADGLAYAVALAEKHGLGYAQLKERLS